MANRYAALLCFFMLCWGAELAAQAPDTLYVYADSIAVQHSRYRHWLGAHYEWLVSGVGNLGSAGTNFNLIADARFSEVDVDEFRKPKLPFDEASNFPLNISLCSRAPRTCNIFLACNAPSENQYRMENMTAAPAAEMKRFRFVPLEDVYNPAHEYRLVAEGSGGPAQFMYVDRYDPGNPGETESFYSDNRTLLASTVYTVYIRRKSPELIIREPEKGGRIRNDYRRGVPAVNVLRRDTLDFGNERVGGSVDIIRLLENRGLDRLETDRVEVSDPNGHAPNFAFLRSDNRAIGAAFGLSHREQLELLCYFEPQSSGRKSIELRFYSNDPTQSGTGQGAFFSLTLLGVGTEAGLSISAEQNGTPLDVLDFGNVRVGDTPRLPLFVKSDGTQTAQTVELSGVAAPFSLSTTQLNDLVPGSTAEVQVDFAPLAAGEYFDTLYIGGRNTRRYAVVLRGYTFAVDSSFIVYSWENRHKLRDTIDFGEIGIAKDRTLEFQVWNYGNIDLQLPGGNKVDPVYIIDRRPTTDLYFDDDGVDLDGDRFIRNRNNAPDSSVHVRTFSMRFVDVVAPGAEQFGKKQQTFTLKLTDVADGLDTVQKEFTLCGTVTDLLFNADMDTLDFGTVYLGCVIDTTLNICNCSLDAFVLDDELLSFNPGGADFEVSKLDADRPGATIDSNSCDSVRFRYAPQAAGSDVGVYRVRYSLDAADDTPADDKILTIPVRAHAVKQQLRAIDVIDGDNPVQFDPNYIDTVVIDYGPVSICNDPRAIFVVLENQGNYPFRVREVREAPGDAECHRADFSLLGTLRAGDVIEPGASDSTMWIQFDPITAGDHCKFYIIESTVADEIACVPARDRRLVLKVRGRGVDPEINYTVNGQPVEGIEFGEELVLADCEGENIRELEIRNTGEQELVLESLRIDPQGSFLVLTGEPVRVPPHDTARVLLRFLPAVAGENNAELIIRHNAECPDSVLRIDLHGRGIDPPEIQVHLEPEIIRARPGSNISIPVRLQGEKALDILETATRLEFRLDYNETLLEFRSLQRAGSVLENVAAADVETEVLPQGGLRVSVESPPGRPFLKRDVLFTLAFATYAGDRNVDDIRVESLSFGNALCQGILKVRSTGATFVADSVCGIHVLTVAGGNGRRFSLLEATPNPAEGQVEIGYSVAFKTQVEIVVYDTRGVVQYRLADALHPAGEYRARLSLDGLAPGVYFYEMKAGIFRDVKRLLLSR